MPDHARRVSSASTGSSAPRSPWRRGAQTLRGFFRTASVANSNSPATGGTPSCPSIVGMTSPLSTSGRIFVPPASRPSTMALRTTSSRPSPSRSADLVSWLPRFW